MEKATSINSVPIRLTDERWVHIIENHDDLAGYYDEVLDVVEYPDYIIKGYDVTFVALRLYKNRNVDFIDAWIIEFAKERGIKTIYTFDKKHFRNIEGIEITIL